MLIKMCVCVCIYIILKKLFKNRFIYFLNSNNKSLRQKISPGYFLVPLHSLALYAHFFM